ncbi:hypothetical protein [Rhizobium sp. Root1204]|uniref:hypothetical protein n=1 Tax=Rhizobium sp. Root1204 TaxID=1736428 RepID=UPI000712B784|nr:hypothetical protein [Rhizobium sp. Root1204]KQV37008.1 hypothetical protein ASC96_26675 [Rhizobium sp. Root1204]
MQVVVGVEPEGGSILAWISLDYIPIRTIKFDCRTEECAAFPAEFFQSRVDDAVGGLRQANWRDHPWRFSAGMPVIGTQQRGSIEGYWDVQDEQTQFHQGGIVSDSRGGNATALHHRVV